MAELKLNEQLYVSALVPILLRQIEIEGNNLVEIRLDKLLGSFGGDFSELQKNILYCIRKGAATLDSVMRQDIFDANPISAGKKIPGNQYLLDDGLPPAYQQTDILRFLCNKTKLKQLTKKSEDRTTREGIVEFLVEDNEGTLQIRGYNPIKFTGIRKDIIQYFYEQEDRNKWRSYKEIKDSIEVGDTHEIRQAIEKINKRVERLTNKKHILLASKPGQDPNAPKEYRWGIS